MEEEASLSPTPIYQNFPVTFVIMGVNIVVFVLMLVNGGATTENLVLFGGKVNGLIAEGELHRLFFPMVIHANLIHLLVNMFGFYQVGRYLESLVGGKRLLIIYIVAGFVGNCFSFAIVDSLSVGASGSLFGVLLCLYVFQKYEERLSSQGLARPPSVSLGFVLVVNIIISFSVPKIDWANHLGGAVAGIFLGLPIVLQHNFRLKRLKAARFLDPLSHLNQLKIYERPWFYYAILALISTIALSKIFIVSFADRSFGRSLQLSAQSRSKPKDIYEIQPFSKVLGSPKSQINPTFLTHAGIAAHKEKNFRKAYFLYKIVISLLDNKFAVEGFGSKTSLALIKTLKENASRNKLYSEDFSHLLELPPSNFSSLKTLDQIHSFKESEAMMAQMGFFQLAGDFAQVLFWSQAASTTTAAVVLKNYWLDSNSRQELNVFYFALTELFPAHSFKELIINPKPLVVDWFESLFLIQTINIDPLKMNPLETVDPDEIKNFKNKQSQPELPEGGSAT